MHDDAQAPEPSAAQRERASGIPDVRTFDVLDMHCAACAVLIEEQLRHCAGIVDAQVYYSTQRARVSFDPGITSPQRIERVVERLGYGVVTTSDTDAGAASVSASRQAAIGRQRQRYIWEFGLGAFCAMQVMMLTLPRFLAGGDMEPELAPLFDWAALVLALPVVLVCARSFYRGALREGRLRRPGMDMAITLGIATAFAGSLWHLFAGTGALYFDSVTMFVALLLGVRWLAWEQRERNHAAIERAAARVTGGTVMRLTPGRSDQHMTPVAVALIRPDDRLWLRTGDAVPVDGILESAIAHCDESLLTGESSPVQHTSGERLVAGSINCGVAITLRAVASVDDSTERRLLTLADRAAKPDSQALADTVARYFMPLLLIVATCGLLLNLTNGMAVALERAIAALVISCPCALALAAPMTQARAFAGLLSRGVVLRRAAALDTIATANWFLLDKTGTLTEPAVAGVSMLRGGLTSDQALAPIAALERAANHPLGKVLGMASATSTATAQAATTPAISELHWTPGAGVSGIVDGVRYRFGRRTFACAGQATTAYTRDDEMLWLVDDAGPVCSIKMGERLRDDAHALVAALQQRGTVELLSGDHPDKTRRVAAELGALASAGATTPEQKAQRVRALQASGHTVAMIGDGVNDSIGFAGANVAVAVASSADATRASADVVCISDRLVAISDAIAFADRARSIMRQNYFWAIAYNVLAIPVALTGHVNPLLAATGMALSSALVMLNVMRLDIAQSQTVQAR